MKGNANRQSDYEKLARVIKALAHPSRLLIVSELSIGKRCVGELTNLVGARMPTVSRHLSQLRAVGIVHEEKRGAKVFYRVSLPCVLKMFECIKSIRSIEYP